MQMKNLLKKLDSVTVHVKWLSFTCQEPHMLRKTILKEAHKHLTTQGSLQLPNSVDCDGTIINKIFFSYEVTIHLSR
jgi:hypothetical protein